MEGENRGGKGVEKKEGEGRDKTGEREERVIEGEGIETGPPIV